MDGYIAAKRAHLRATSARARLRRHRHRRRALPRHRRQARAAAERVIPISAAARGAGRRLRRGRHARSTTSDGAARTSHRSRARSRACPGRHNWQNAAAAYAAARALGPRRADAVARHRQLPRPRAPPGADRDDRRRALRQRFARRPTPTPPPTRSPATTTSIGSPAAAPRKAASPRWRRYFPRIRHAFLIGEAARRLRRDARRPRAATTIAARSSARVAAALRAARGRRGRRRAAVAGLRLLRPVRRFRGARRGVPRASSQALAGSARHELRPHRSERRRRNGGGRSTAGPCSRSRVLIGFGALHGHGGEPGGRRAHRRRQPAISCTATSSCCRWRWRSMFAVSLLSPRGVRRIAAGRLRRARSCCSPTRSSAASRSRARGAGSSCRACRSSRRSSSSRPSPWSPPGCSRSTGSTPASPAIGSRSRSIGSWSRC